MRDITLERKQLQHFPEDGPHRTLVAVRSKEGRAKVYRTFWKVNSREIVLATTSKDLHLGIGLLGRDGIDALCHLIEGEHRHGAPSEFMLNFEPGDASLHVLRSTEGEKILYSLSSAPTERHTGH